ncbi:MAG: serine hydrolase domain-containing protein [Bacteroidota bacterium]
MKKYVPFIFMISLLAGCKKQVRKKPLSMDEVNIEKVRSFLKERALKDSLHGVVLIGKNDEILLHEAYGYVDLDSIEEHTLNTRIGQASLGKMFTAISIMQLVSEGKIDLDDLASSYLKDIENPTIRDSVKIKHLLSHTSGMGSYWKELRATDEIIGDELNFIYSLVKNDTLRSPVGKTFGYSNSGFILLGRIVEKVSGMKYADYVNRNVFERSGMTDSEIKVSAGGGTGTAEDLWSFGQALKAGKLLAKDKFEIMTKKQSDVGYGYGFMLNEMGNSISFGHNGGFWNGDTLGNAAYFFVFNNGYTIISLSNRNPDIGGIGDKLTEILVSKNIEQN